MHFLTRVLDEFKINGKPEQKRIITKAIIKQYYNFASSIDAALKIYHRGR